MTDTPESPTLAAAERVRHLVATVFMHVNAVQSAMTELHAAANELERLAEREIASARAAGYNAGSADGLDACKRVLLEDVGDRAQELEEAGKV